LTPGNREKVVEMDAYRIALLQLFAHHSVETIELSTLYRAELDVPVLPPEVYKGNNHFHSDGVVYPFIVEKVVAPHLPIICYRSTHGNQLVIP